MNDCKRAIEAKWNLLGGAPGTAVSGLEYAVGGFRIRYEHGAIYAKGAGDAPWVYGDIGARYDQLGGAESWLGFPVADEEVFAQGGRLSRFEKGGIYWWPDKGAVELNNVVVRYTGIVCFGETDSDGFGSDSDEPYVVIGVVAPLAESTNRTQVYDDVDAGESRGDSIEIFRGPPFGINISTLLMEHDEGDPDKYKAAMASAVGAAFTGVTTVVGLIPVVGGVLAAVAAPLLGIAAPVVTEELNALLGTGDDRLGETTLVVTARDMVILAARTAESNERGVVFKLVTPPLTGDGSTYKVYFTLIPI